MELCVKLSKKVKSLQSQKKDLAAVVKQQHASQQEFLSFFKDEVVMEVDVSDFGPMSVAPAPPTPGSAVKPPPAANLPVLRSAWRAADERKGLMLQEMQKEMQNIVFKHQAEVEKIRKEHEEQVRRAVGGAVKPIVGEKNGGVALTR